jgi:hypothetical protein
VVKQVAFEEFGLRLLEIEEERKAYTKKGPEAYGSRRPEWEERLREGLVKILYHLDLGELDMETSPCLLSRTTSIRL